MYSKFNMIKTAVIANFHVAEQRTNTSVYSVDPKKCCSACPPPPPPPGADPGFEVRGGVKTAISHGPTAR